MRQLHGVLVATTLCLETPVSTTPTAQRVVTSFALHCRTPVAWVGKDPKQGGNAYTLSNNNGWHRPTRATRSSWDAFHPRFAMAFFEAGPGPLRGHFPGFRRPEKAHAVPCTNVRVRIAGFETAATSEQGSHTGVSPPEQRGPPPPPADPLRAPAGRSSAAAQRATAAPLARSSRPRRGPWRPPRRCR